MKLLLLGTAGYHPSETRHTACLMLPEEGIVLDAGTGFFRVRQHLQSPSLDILLTHAHLDHVAGLTFLLSTLFERQMERVTVYGAADKLAAVREHLLSEHLFPAPLPCEWHPLAAGPLQVGAARVTHFPLVHTGGSIGYRLDFPGRSLAYITDTTAAADAPYVSQLAGVDLLVHECNFPDGQEAWAAKTGHSCATPVAQIASAARAKRLILTHLDPLGETTHPIDLAAMRKIFPATELGRDGMEIEW
jgi:ribonuclease BN (tRNA processing enzyme)